MKYNSSLTEFQIMSDLHIEYNSDMIPNPLKFITPVSDNLILAGDIGSLYKFEQLKGFLTELCKLFKIVIYVPGNHEYYKMKNYKPETMYTLFQRFISLKNIIPNLYILNRSFIQINNVIIFGCTLWSKWTTELNIKTNKRYNIPKFIVRIHEMTTDMYDSLHKEDLKYLTKCIESVKNTNLKLLVVTHHSPTYHTTKHKNKFTSLYGSHLDYLLDYRLVHTWIFGHTHRNINNYINPDINVESSTNLISNQFGKPKDNIKNYSKIFKIKI